jgi:stearoyl-CoA desaturase (Delta-9 desaturase)
MSKSVEKNWPVILFLGGTPIIGVLGTLLYTLKFGVVWWEPVLCMVLWAAMGMSIGSGYHRYFSHKTYEMHPAVEWLFLLVGSLALQNSVLIWASDHRDHHRYTDKEHDPYSVTRGFWWAHIVWMFYRADPEKDFSNVPDLLRNPRVMWQHRWSTPLGIVVGLGLPLGIGALLGHPIGGLLWGGFLRITLVHQTTFLVNSVAHLWGKRPFDAHSTARDNGFVALFTHGEGWHNYHHKFPTDWRNGIRWWQWDPNKWLIGTLAALGLARNLYRVPQHVIDAARKTAALATGEASEATELGARSAAA